MKKIILFIFIIPLTIFGQKYQEPDLVNLINAEYNESRGSNFPQFGLIGWSKDGYFAYRIIFSNGGIGVAYDAVLVYNLKNDKVVNEIFFGSADFDGPYDYYETDVWRYNQRKIDKVLSDYNIIQNSSNILNTKRYIDKYEIVLKNRTSMCEEPEYGWDYGEEYEHEYRLLVGNSKTGYKKVGNGLQGCGSSSMNFEGYYISPFENRIVIVLSSYTLGYESEEDWNLDFFGCSLNPRTF